MGYISQQGAANLATYKYSGVDNSVLAKLFFSRFWNWLVEFIPRDVAPNFLTLCGLCSVLLMYLIVYSYCPELEGVAPRWVYFMCAVCIFVYQTLDNLDGKQARRTGSSSALGEAFDHGGDSLTTMLFSMTLGTVFQFGPVLTFIFQILLILVFFFCHWEAYFTGVLILRPLDNPTEAQCTLMLLMLITMIAGPLFWLTEVNILFVGPVQLNQILFFIYVIGSLNTCLDNISKVNDHLTNLQMKKTGAALCLLPLGIMLTLSVMSAWFSPTLLLDHPRLFLGSVGLMFSYLQIRLIIQNVCKEPFKPFYNVLIPLFLFTFNCFLEVRGDPIMDTGFLIKAYFFYCFGLVCYLIYSVVNELTTILNIRAFVINPVPISRV